MSTEIKNTLFRFVSMRAPELTDDNKPLDGFVFRDDGVTKGAFDTAVASLTDSASKWQAMKTAAASFEALSVEAIKKIDPALYELSVSIAKNRLSYDVEKFLEMIQPLRAIEDKEVLGRLWDNLFYQTLTQETFYAKETIIQLLIANHVLSNYGGDKNRLDALLNAKVVLPKALFGDSESENANQQKVSASKDEAPKASVPTSDMAKQQRIAQAEFHNQQLNQLSKELKRVEKAYQKERTAALELAEAGYQKEVKPILDQYTKDVEAEKKRWCEIKDPNVDYDPKDPCNQPNTIPEPVLPDFKFDFRKELDFEFLQSKLSPESFETLSDLVLGGVEEKSGSMERIEQPTFDTFTEDYEGFTDIDGHIHEVISGNDNTISENAEDEGTTLVSVGGVVVPVNTGNTFPDFSYQLCSKPIVKPPFGLKYNADLRISVPDASWQVASFDYTLERTDQDHTNNGLETYSVLRLGNTIFLKNINIGWPRLSEQAQLESFTGTITFTNGVVKTFSTPDFVLRTCTSGVLIGEIIDPNDNDNPPNPGTSNETPFVPSGFGVKQLGIADYNKVEQSTQGYVEGDVAHIENVMAREFKERSTRRLRRKEDTFTSSSESEREQLTDTTSTERFEMQNEVSKMIADSKDFSASAGVNYNPTEKLSLFANANYATHNSKEQSTLQAITNSKDITERALDRIVTKVKEERIEKIVEEFEENNSHGFDNRKGDKHVVGVFRWVDKIFKNQVINYGKRLMFEFMVPQPGKLHKLGMAENNAGNTNDTMLVEPTDPRKSTTQSLKDFTMLTDSKLKYWAGKYNVEFNPKPKQYISVGESFHVNLNGGSSLSHTESNSGNGKIKVPEGYKTVSARGIFNASSDGDLQGNILSLTIGDYTKTYNNSFGRYSLQLTGPIAEFVNEVPVSYTLGNHISGDVSASVRCRLTTEHENKWKQETFKAIIDAYEDALAAFNEKLEAETELGVQIKGTNPGFYREFENKILRKNCISYLIDQNPGAQNTYGKSNLFTTTGGGPATFGNLEVNVNQALDNYSAFVKFMEQAFEWDIMSYNLYPYYWGNRQDWSNLYQYDETNDPLFRNFMQAGMARVIVTVRPGFEEAVRYYMQTGQIWNGGEVPVIEDELYLSLVEELRQPEGEKLGKAWATRVPTALTILQAQSIGLNVNKALPYLDDLSDFENPDEVPQSQQFELNDAEIGISESDGERHIENVDIVNGYLQLNTDDTPRQVVAQISMQSIKNAIDDLV
ncbi:hypothetical protein [uncultured Psychroserpens sp.]|uniref:hypothetical protein n=1 Tax=uncultured Psychroserpens sp. TaxID=255436 RepID=UPI002620A05D|nr:hypothetical protein [uncultured Psychroserpens sp.]